jgi:hypothetical protein
MKTFILFIAALMLVLGAVSAQETCSATMQYYFGTHCLNPYQQNLPGFYPIGSYVEFYRPDNTTDIGRVTGYSWQVERQAYAYYLAVSPVYQIQANGISGINEVVYPEFIFFSNQGLLN